MNDKLILDPIDGYIKSISQLLPYRLDVKAQVLEELRKDVLDAMGNEKRPPSVVFGSPQVVARNLSNAHDWGTKTASWLRRFIASGIDFILLMSVLIIFTWIRIVFTDFEIDMIKWHTLEIPFGLLFVSIPIISLMLGYFILFEQAYSTTLGKRVMGLIVVDESGIKITWTQSFIRNITKVPFLTSFLPFDFLLGILSDKTKGRNQRVLDFVAGTVVVQNK